MKKKNLFFMLKFIFGLGLLLYLALVIARPREIIVVLKGASWPMMLLAFSLHALGYLISAKRWKLILDSRGGGFSIPQLIRSLLVGTFFNLFLPTRFGGDVVRVNDTRHMELGMTASLAVIVYERLSGIVVLLFFALFASLARVAFIRELPMLYVSLLVGLLGILLLLLAWKSLPRGFLARLECKRPWLLKILGKLDAFHGIILDFLHHRALTRKVFLWAILLQFNVILHYYLIGQALRLERIPLTDYFFSIPIMLFILSIPISINGLGVRDLFLVRLFTYYRYPAQFGLAFSMLDLGFILLLGIIGGLIYIFRKI